LQNNYLLNPELLTLYILIIEGFQPRFCRIDAERGVLVYYLLESDENVASNPRGTINLLNGKDFLSLNFDHYQKSHYKCN
jgi:hypothetical protein